MISALFLALALLLKDTPDVTRANAFAELIAIHRRDWSNIDVESVLRSQPNYKRVDAEIPEGSRYRSGVCDGSSYLIHETSVVYVRFEFEQFARGQSCGTRLRAATVEQLVPATEAERLRIELLRDLRAAGPVVGAPYEYHWRSNDSRVKFVLTLFAESSGASADGAVRLVAKLRHLTVSPDSVDTLPFERGYFPPTCGP